jgi:isoleucyl-tRNA synthetase
MHADHVTTESGTGLVHMAPVHGHDDYQAFAAMKMLPEDLHCPVNDEGRFDDTMPSRLAGKEVLGDGTNAVICMLQQQGMLLAEELLRHRYPYDWKTKTPVIIR